MVEFDIDRQLYFSKIKTNLSVIEELSDYKDKKTEELYRIVLFPRNEEELVLANNYTDILMNIENQKKK